MQGNDLGSYWSVKFVVLAEPTIFEPPTADSYRFPIGKRGLGKLKVTADDYLMNRDMVAWINNIGRMRSIPTEIWTFIYDDDIVAALATKLDRLAGQAIVGWRQWADEEEAQFDLKVDASIHTVYDADSDRVERLWGMRGHRVLRGGTPSS